MKRFIAAFMFLVFLFSVFHITAFAEQADELTEVLTKTMYRYREKEFMVSTSKLSSPWILYDTSTGYKHGSRSYIYPFVASKGGTSSGYTSVQADQWRLSNESRYCFHGTHTRVYQYMNTSSGTYMYTSTSASVDNSQYVYVNDYWRFEICTGKTSYTNYHYYQWSEWSEWSETPVVASENVEVETKGPALLYRYREKVFTESKIALEEPWVLYNTTTEYEHGGFATVVLSSSETIGSSYCVHYKEAVNKYIKPGGRSWFYATSSEYINHLLNNSSLSSYTSESGYDRYTYCTRKTPYSMYHYYKWGEWNEWSNTPVVESDDVEVETRIDVDYTITYDANGGDNAPPAAIKGHDFDMVLSDVVPNRVNHEFLGWSTTANGNVEYLPEDVFSLNGNISLYAVWKNITEYTISYESYGETEVPPSQSKIHDETIILSDMVPAKVGFVFQGWAITLGGDVVYVPNDCYSENADMILYPVWKTCTHRWNEGAVTSEPSHTTTGTRLLTCLDCKATKTEDVEKDPEHNYGDWEKHNDVQHKKVCECGDVIYVVHNWDEGVDTSAPSHTTTGTRLLTCLDCKATKTEDVEKDPEHNYGDWEKHNDVQHKKVCECGDVIYVVHNWDEGVDTSAPSHTTTGIRLLTCLDCKATRTKTLDKLTNHNYGVWQKYDGLLHNKTCECGDVVYSPHSWDEGVVTVEPEHTSIGSKMYTCLVCGETQTEDIPKLPEHTFDKCQKHNDMLHQKSCECGAVLYSVHSWDGGTIVTAPNCNTEGLKIILCSECGEYITESLPKTTEHKYESTLIVSPKCITDGMINHICTICGDSYTEVVKAVGHTEKIDAAVLPSCTKPGLAEGRHCSVCGLVMLEQTEVKALGHTESVNKGYAATCTEHGLTDWIQCSVCNEVVSQAEYIKAKGHSTEKEWTTISSNAGKIEQVKYCMDCGAIVETREITQDIINPSVPTDSTEATTESTVVTDPTKPSTGDDTPPSEPVVDKGILGDVNGDGKVNVKDATLIQKAAAKIIALSDAERLRADVNNDTKVNVKDATAIQKFAAKIETGFPIGEAIVS